MKVIIIRCYNVIMLFKIIHLAFFKDEIRIRELERVMDIYIPNAVLRHHKVLYETRDIIPEYVSMFS